MPEDVMPLMLAGGILIPENTREFRRARYQRGNGICDSLEEAIRIDVEYTDKKAHSHVYGITFGRTTRFGGLRANVSRASQENKMGIRTARLGRQTVQRVIALAHCPYLSAESERGGGGKRPAVGVDVCDNNLD